MKKTKKTISHSQLYCLYTRTDPQALVSYIYLFTIYVYP